METPGFVDSKFRLAILAAKRAKQLVGGSKKRVNIDAENPLTVALEEIYQGKISFQIFDEEQMLLEQDQEEAALEKLEEELLGSYNEDEDDLEEDQDELEEDQDDEDDEQDEEEDEDEDENDDEDESDEDEDEEEEVDYDDDDEDEDD